MRPYRLFVCASLAKIFTFRGKIGVAFMSSAKVGVVMGSQSDWDTMQHSVQILNDLQIDNDVRIVSAHRTPERLYKFAKSARNEGFSIIIAGAGGAAHLPGMLASLTSLPVFGVPVKSAALKGIDSLYSIVQMPAGIPVGTLAIGKAGAINAALLAASILANQDNSLLERLDNWRSAQTKRIDERPEM